MKCETWLLYVGDNLAGVGETAADVELALEAKGFDKQK